MTSEGYTAEECLLASARVLKANGFDCGAWLKACAWAWEASDRPSPQNPLIGTHVARRAVRTAGTHPGKPKSEETT